jgi:hypothetical protein
MLKRHPAAFSDHEIRVRAYRIWEKKGKPEGHAEENWREALAELQAEAAAESASVDRVPARPEVSTPPVRIAAPAISASRPRSEAA